MFNNRGLHATWSLLFFVRVDDDNLNGALNGTPSGSDFMVSRKCATIADIARGQSRWG